MTTVAAAPLRIVAIGASNTQGWYVGNEGAYPAKLQALLKAKGIDAQVVNAGVPFDTTAGMLKRIDSDVPTGTDIEPGANDRRFLGTKEQRAANIAPVARDPVQAPGVLDRIVDRRRPKRLSIRQEPLRIAGRDLTEAGQGLPSTGCPRAETRRRPGDCRS
jgi:acyl-CoA thioesterase-1